MLISELYIVLFSSIIPQRALRKVWWSIMHVSDRTIALNIAKHQDLHVPLKKVIEKSSNVRSILIHSVCQSIVRFKDRCPVSVYFLLQFISKDAVFFHSFSTGNCYLVLAGRIRSWIHAERYWTYGSKIKKKFTHLHLVVQPKLPIYYIRPYIRLM